MPLNLPLPISAGFAFFFGALTLTDTAQVFTFVAAVVAAISVGRGRRRTEQNRELRDSVESKDILIETLRTDLVGAAERAKRAEDHAHECSDQLIHWKAKYDEQERYTAQGALEQVASRLGSLESAIITAVQSQGELILKNTEILAKLDEHLSGPSR